MDKPTVQDIFCQFYPDYLDKYSPSLIQAKVANCIINCKTGAYGANVSVCEDCGHLHIHYNSCRNRCCPMCQALPKEKWMDARREDVLDAPYFHVVFTVPQELNPVIYSNQKLLYDVFYHTVSATINELTADSKYLGANVGYICILHTWGSELNFHPHIHVILLGGGLTEKNHWKDKGSEFFLPVKEKKVAEYIIIGYAATKAEGLQMLADYNSNPYDTKAAKMTFSDVYEEWSKKKYPTVSESNVKGYTASYKACAILYNRVFKDMKLADLQQVIDTCGKNFPTLRKIKVLFNQLYDFALKNDICNKDYSTFVDITQYKDRNPNKYDRNKFSKEEVAKIWTMKDDKYYQIILMLLHNGTRISEFLDLKKENVHLDKQYFDVIDSKTENGIRKVPIADKLLPFYKAWYDSCPDCEYLLHTEDGKHFKYRNYYDSYWTPLMEQLGIERTPHCTRHTCISMLSEAGVQDTTIKKIVGHSGAMSLTERVYTHLDMQILVDVINKTVDEKLFAKSA